MDQAQDAHGRALALAREGRLEAALAGLGDAEIAENARALGLRGTLLAMSGQPKQALEAFERSVILDPSQPAVHADMGSALVQLKRTKDAIACFDRALEIDPSYLVALNNRCIQWLELREPELALADAVKALAINPSLTSALRIRARANIMLRRFEDARLDAERAVESEPGRAYNHTLFAMALDSLGRYDEALLAFNRAVALSPDDAPLIKNRALLRLRIRDFPGGWEDFESRWRSKFFLTPSLQLQLERLPRLDLNNSAADLAGKRVLVLCEQGTGDQIMFASALPDLAAICARVVCVVDIRLQSLFDNSFPGVETQPNRLNLEGLDLNTFDRIIPLGSLGKAFRNRIEDFPGTPYLKPQPETVAAWREKLGPRRAPMRVGIAWRGGTPKTGTDYRSLNLETLRPLLIRSDCEFVSLQYGKVAGEVAQANASLPMPIRLFPREETENFEHQAGLVQALDIVVSVQQALIHLCGAIGAPCLAMLPSITEWRYGIGDETMPWYGDAVRLIRQDRQGDWGSVFDQVGAELEHLAALTQP